MKRIILSTAVALFAISTAFSQSLDIRAYGGINILQLTTDQGTSLIDGALHHKTVSGRSGFQLGGAVTFGERFYIQPGVQYGVLSTKVVNQNTVTGTEFTDETTLKTISVPLKVGFRLIDPETENIFNVRLFAGINGNHVMSVDHNTKSGKIDIDQDDYSNLILNTDFGMGVDLFVFFIDFGYSMGLSPVHATGGDNAKANAMYTNFGLRISL